MSAIVLCLFFVLCFLDEIKELLIEIQEENGEEDLDEEEIHFV